ncbi:MAG: hypothetical protein ACRDDA_00215, partial [Aeromonas sp.]
MVVKDTQPFSVVEDEGFRALVSLLDPTYILPTRKALKAMVAKKHIELKEKAQAEVRKVAVVSLTSDMWTSINTDAYMAVTCHYVTSEWKLSSILLGVAKFPKTHTAAHIAEAKATLMREWSISGKVSCMVTDGAANMVACVETLKIRHAHCFAHGLNLVVKKAIDSAPELEDLRNRGRKIVGHFRSSTTAKDKLSQFQHQMGRPQHKLIQEVETRWNSTFAMFQRLYEQREPLGAVLPTLRSELSPFTAEEYESMNQCLGILGPFHQATVEMSEEKRVSGSKVIPMIKMLKTSIREMSTQMTSDMGSRLAANLLKQLNERFATHEQ